MTLHARLTHTADSLTDTRRSVRGLRRGLGTSDPPPRTARQTLDALLDLIDRHRDDFASPVTVCGSADTPRVAIYLNRAGGVRMDIDGTDGRHRVVLTDSTQSTVDLIAAMHRHARTGNVAGCGETVGQFLDLIYDTSVAYVAVLAIARP